MSIKQKLPPVFYVLAVKHWVHNFYAEAYIKLALIRDITRLQPSNQRTIKNLIVI